MRNLFFTLLLVFGVTGLFAQGNCPTPVPTPVLAGFGNTAANSRVLTANKISVKWTTPASRSKTPKGTAYSIEFSWRRQGTTKWTTYRTAKMTTIIDSVLISSLNPDTWYELRARTFCHPTGYSASTSSNFSALYKFRTSAVNWCDTVKAPVVDDVQPTQATFAYTPVIEYDPINNQKRVPGYAIRWREMNSPVWNEQWYNDSTKKMEYYYISDAVYYDAASGKIRFTLTGLLQGTTYEYQFATFCSDKNVADRRMSDWQHFSYKFTTPTLGCTAPTGVQWNLPTGSTSVDCGWYRQVYDINLQQVSWVRTWSISWLPVNEARYYQVYWREVSTNPSQPNQFVLLDTLRGKNNVSMTLGYTNALYIDNNIPAIPGINKHRTVIKSGKAYQFVIRAVCANGVTTTWSRILSLNAGATCTRLADSNNDATFTVYPNPSNGNFVVSLNNNTNPTTTVKVLDITGRVVFDKTYNVDAASSSLDVDMTGVGAGMYVLQVQNGENTQQQKIVIN